MIYKYSQIVFGIILLYNVTKQHYIPPPDFCTFAKTCNHTGVSVCGVEKNLNTRLFLDECDLFEYNCDKHKEYAETNMEKCPSNETGLNSTVTLSSITTTATLNISVPVETAASANTSVILNITAASANTSAILNITAASANTSEILNITAASANISAILNITAASANTSEILNITAASANTSAILNTTATSANKSEILNTTLTKSSTKSSSVPAEITTIITRNNSSSAKLNLNITCVCPTVTCPVLNNTTTMISQNVTTASIDTIPVIVLSTEKTNNVISKKVTTNLPNTISIINETVISPIVSTTTNSTKTALTICTHRIITSNTSSLIEKNTTTASTVPKSSPNKEDGQTTTGKKKQNGTNTSQDKCAYPNSNRPSTWETTVKGETRDFYQILRAQFGDRVKILRDTTHFPRRIAKEINDDDEAFHFGYHNERMNEVL